MNTPGSSADSRYRLKHRRGREVECHCCRRAMPFCWSCRCGFRICQECMQANLWGMTCNGITWDCPDCGAPNGFGNQ